MQLKLFYYVCIWKSLRLTIKIILLLLFSGHSQDESQSDGPEIEQEQVQPQ